MKKSQAFRLLRYIPAVLVLAMCMPALSPSQTARIDSLQRVLKQATNDSARIDVLLRLAATVRGSDASRAVEFARQAVTIAKRSPSGSLKAMAFTGLGMAQSRQQRSNESRQSFEAAVKQAEAAGSLRLMLHPLRELGFLGENSGNPENAREYYLRVLRTAEECGDSAYIGAALADLSDVSRTLGETEKSLEYSLRSLALSTRRGDRWNLVVSHGNIGDVYRRLGRNKEALEHFQQGMAIAEQLRDMNLLATLLNNLAILHQGQGDFNAALDAFQQSQSVHEKTGNRRGVANALGNAGHIHAARGEYETAIRSYEGSLAVYREIGDSSGVTGMLIGIGGIMEDKGEFENALEQYERALRIAERIQHMAAVAAALNNMALVYARQGKYTEALDPHRRALRIREEAGDAQGVAESLGNLSIVHRRLGQLERALEYAQRGLTKAEEIGNPAVISSALHNIGAVHHDQQRDDQALPYFQRSLELNEALGRKSQMAKNLNSIGGIHFEKGRLEQALASYLRGRAISDTLGDAAGIALAEGNIAGTYRKLKRFDEAISHYRRSLEIAESIGDRPGVVFILTEMADAAGARMDYDSAIILAERAFQGANEIGNPAETAAAAEVLHAAYVHKGNFAKAYEYLVTAKDLRDSLMNETNLRTINDMEAKYSTAEKEKAIARLEAEKQGQLLALEQKDRLLVVQRLTAERNRHHAEILKQDQELQRLELETSRRNLELRENELKLHKLWKEKLTSERNYEASIASRETSLRNVLLLGLLMTLAVGFLSFKRIQSRRREALLQAEAAEYRVKAAETQALAMQVEIERRERMSQQRYTKQLIYTQEAERKRIAGALHDSLGQELLVIKNRTLLALQSVTLSAEARGELEQIEHMATAALQNVRHISHDLRPYQLDRVGLTKTLRSTLQQLGAKTDLRIEFLIDDIDGLLSKDDETNIYRIVQECLNNVLKHSAASRTDVRITRDEDRIAIVVSDNGKGTDPAATAGASHGFGLQNMRERAVMLGGSMQIGAEAGGGTRVELVIPIRRVHTALA